MNFDSFFYFLLFIVVGGFLIYLVFMIFYSKIIVPIKQYKVLKRFVDDYEWYVKYIYEKDNQDNNSLQ